MQRFILRFAMGLAVLFASPITTFGQFFNQAIGGVSIDAQGQISSLTAVERTRLANDVRQRLAPSPDDLHGYVAMRMVSLQSLEQEITSSLNAGRPLAEEVQFLGGLLRIEYVFVDADANDIVLAGPAEGWHVGPTGDVVGISTGLPVVQLDDLLVALRTVQSAAQVGITCSIDPTAEGRQAFTSLLRQQKTFVPAVTRAIEQALGQQVITLTGVPEDSHFAQVLVASDYRMKRLAMNLEPAPFPGLPSFLDLIKSSRGGLSNMMPRWWMACNYDSIARSEDGLSWQIRGQGVKVLTEDELVSAEGEVAQSGQANPVAQTWADNMTKNFDALSRREPIFGQLRNLMDLCVAAALIEKESLMDKADVRFPLLTGEASQLEIMHCPHAKTVASQSSFIKKGHKYIITASGGVQVDSWRAAANQEVVPEIAAKREAALLGAKQSWRW